MVDRRIGIGIGKSMLTNGIRRTLAALSNVATPDSHFETATVAIPVWNNYYHWTIECLPIIRLLDKYAENHDKYPTLLVPSDRPSWMDESLDRIDYDGPVVSWPGGVSHIGNLIVPTYPDPIPAECRWLRDRMRDSHNVADDAPKRIYISRTDATVRQVENIDKIKPIFDDYGFDTVVLSELTVVEQIKLFTNAEIVVSPHGAGLTNVVYADEITVIELFGRKKMTTFARLADMLDHDYSFLDCEQRGVNLVVDPERLDTAIERAVEA
jgi:capsular polysaccharide biosynthesis protein